MKTSRVATLAALVAVAALVLLTLGPALSASGLTAPMFGFRLFTFGFLGGLLGLVLGLVGLFTTRATSGAGGGSPSPRTECLPCRAARAQPDLNRRIATWPR